MAPSAPQQQPLNVRRLSRRNSHATPSITDAERCADQVDVVVRVVEGHPGHEAGIVDQRSCRPA